MVKKRLAIVSEREIIRQGLMNMLEAEAIFELIPISGTTMEAIEECAKHRPDVIIIGSLSSEAGGIKVIESIHQRLPRAYIVVISESNSSDELISTVSAGVRAYLSPNISAKNLISAITLIIEGKLVVSPHISENLIRTFQLLSVHGHIGEEKIGFLTQQEKKVLSLVRRGSTNKEIGTTLNICENTVKVHLRNVMEKLHAHTRQEAVALVAENDLIGKN